MKKHLFTLMYVLFMSNLYAELPPYVYEDLRNNSPEIITIKVIKITSSSILLNLFKSTKDIKLEAKVLHVNTSESGLKAGDRIDIFYSTVTSRPKGWVGPSSLPVLEQSEVYTAYLRKDDQGNYYVPSAKGKSFE